MNSVYFSERRGRAIISNISFCTLSKALGMERTMIQDSPEEEETEQLVVYGKSGKYMG